MGDLIADAEFFSGGGGVAATDDGGGTGSGFSNGLGHGLGTTPKGAQNAGGPFQTTVSHRGWLRRKACGFRGRNRGLRAVGDAALNGGGAGVGAFAEVVGGDEVHGQVHFHALGCGLGQQFVDNFGALGVKEGFADGHALGDFKEGEGHAAANDHFVDLVEHALYQLDFVGHLGTAEDGEEGALGVIQGLAEVGELFLSKSRRRAGAGRRRPSTSGRGGRCRRHR